MEAEGTPSPLDPVKGFYAALRDLSSKVVVLQERLKDVIGLKEAADVWKRNEMIDSKLRGEVKKKVDDFVRGHEREEVKEFLKNALFEYYTRRGKLAKALSKMENVSPSSNLIKVVTPASAEGEKTQIAVVDAAFVDGMRKRMAEISDVHTLLTSILKGPIGADSVDNKAMVDDAYLSSLAKDLSLSSSALFINAYSRFGDMVEEIESAERQVKKLEDRVASFLRSDEAEADKAKVKELEAKLESYLQSEEAVAAKKKLACLTKLKRKRFPKGSKSENAKKLDKQIDAVRDKIDSFLTSPEAQSVREELRKQRSKVMDYRKSPEVASALLLVEKRKSAVATISQRLVSEAERFCKTRNSILKAVANATNKILSRCRDLPEEVRDVFRKNPPQAADDIVAANSKLSYSKK